MQQKAEASELDVRRREEEEDDEGEFDIAGVAHVGQSIVKI